MKKTIIIIVILILLTQWNIPMTISSISGEYIMTNYRSSSSGDYPNKADTLILKTNKTFTSGYYGSGFYKVELGLFSSKIYLSYNNGYGPAGVSAFFSNKIYEKPKILLNDDLNQYYLKK